MRLYEEIGRMTERSVLRRVGVLYHVFWCGLQEEFQIGDRTQDRKCLLCFIEKGRLLPGDLITFPLAKCHRPTWTILIRSYGYANDLDELLYDMHP